MDVFGKQHYFHFKKHKYGPYDYTIEVISRRIREFQQYYNVANYVNGISQDSMLECIATLLFLLETNGPLSEDDLVKQFKLWSEDKASRFSETIILSGIAYLCDTEVIEKSLIGYRIV